MTRRKMSLSMSTLSALTLGIMRLSIMTHSIRILSINYTQNKCQSEHLCVILRLAHRGQLWKGKKNEYNTYYYKRYFNIFAVFENTLFSFKRNLFVVNWLKWYYELRYLFSGALCNLQTRFSIQFFPRLGNYQSSWDASWNLILRYYGLLARLK
jgi:hypothetical protein